MAINIKDGESQRPVPFDKLQSFRPYLVVSSPKNSGMMPGNIVMPMRLPVSVKIDRILNLSTGKMFTAGGLENGSVWVVRHRDPVNVEIS
jgi:hypothetical protein